MARFSFLPNQQTEQICWNGGEKDGIHPVEDAAVTGDDVAAVLHTGLALEQGLYQVTHQPENLDDEREHDPLPQFQPSLLEIRDVGKPDGQPHRENATAKEALPSFARGDVRGELMLAEKRAEDVCGSVGHPNQDQEGQHQHGLFGNPKIKENAQRNSNPNRPNGVKFWIFAQLVKLIKPYHDEKQRQRHRSPKG